MTDPRNRAERLASPPEADAERLAALLDGRLDERQRAEAVARLASSDDEFEAFVDALAVTRELEAEDEAAGVTPLRQRGWRPGGHWATMAAVLVGLALLPVLWNRSRAPDIDDPGRFPALLESRDAGLPTGWDRSPWRTTRGPGDPLTPEARAVRVGAHLTDLEVAIGSGDPRVPQLAAEIEALLSGVPAGGMVTSDYRAIGRRAGETQEQLKPLLERGRTAAAALLGEEVVALGAWAEAGRIAAARRDARFFRTGETRAILDQGRDMADLPEPARALIERIRFTTERDGTPEWDLLGRELTGLLRVLGD